MRRKVFYTKFALRCFRFISLLCALLLFVTECNLFYKNSQNVSKNWYEILTDVINITSLIFFIFTSIFPQRFGGLSLIAFIYACFIIPFEPNNFMGFLMYFLGTSLLLARGLLKKHRQVKLSFLVLILFILCLTRLRFGFSVFLNYFINSLGGILVLCLYTFFLHAHYIDTLVYEDKKLNIASYSKLNERDCRILQKIQNGEKYSIIAKEENITEGSLKNRLHFVFSTMEVGDKLGFLSYYDDYELFFESEDVKLPESQEELQ